MAQKKKTAPETQLVQDLNRAIRDGFDSLTKPALRRIRNAAIERLKVVDKDSDVKRRAIEQDIFPIARSLFSEAIKYPDDVDAESLTKLFAEKSNDKDSNISSLNDDTLAAIKNLAQAWGNNFENVKYKGQAATVSSAGKDGLQFRAAGKARKSLGTKKFWPELDFRPTS